MKAVSVIKRAVTAYEGWADVRWRRPPNLTVLPSSGKPVVYYLSPSEQRPSGGVKVIYQHVDVLNSMGVSAAVLHQPDGFRCTWFENQTKVVSAREIRFHADDILVVPECYGAGLHYLPAQIRTVIFNQGPHHTFDRIDVAGSGATSPYAKLENLIGFLTVSDDGAELLRYAFPSTPVAVARNVIDPAVFRPRTGPAAHRIGYIPSRRPEEVHQLRHIVRAQERSGLAGWDLVEISGRTEAQVADIMRSCGVFLSLSDRDGFGLPPAEAMASGCYVVGYPGGGGREFFDPEYCSPVEDFTGLVRGLLAAASMDGPVLDGLGLKASARILGRYTEDGLRADLMAFYGGLS